MDKLFKSLIVVSTIAYIAWFFQPYNTEYIYDKDTIDALQWAGFGGNYFYLSYFSYVLFVLYLVSAFGMLLYIKRARQLFVILTIINIVSVPFAGLAVSTSIDNFLINITGLCDGAVLFMAFFSSISTNFEAHNNQLQATQKPRA